MQQFNYNSINRALNALNNNKFVKLICGASNTDYKQIERLATVYSLAGVDVIDISADKDTYQAAQNGIKSAKNIYNNNPEYYEKFNEPLIMISLNSGSDPHFKKAVINRSLCSNCLDCVLSCPAGALYEDSGILQHNSKRCYGCARCIDICKNKAITLNNNKTEIYIPDNIDAVEIHTGNSSINQVKCFIEENSYIKQAGLISFSVESGLFSREELIHYVSSLTALIDNRVIIQIDGKPMGANNTASSSLQALAGVQILSEINSGFYIQIAGGINHLTKKYLKLFNLPISGVGYGTFARKIILPYIVGLNDTEFYASLKKCVNITTNLVDNNGKSVRNVV